MSHSLPALAFVLALQSFEVAGHAVYLREPVLMSPRDEPDSGDNNDDDDDGTSTTSHTTTSTTTSSTTSTSTTTSSTTSSSTTTSSTTSTSTITTSTSQSSSTATTSGTLTSFSSSYTSFSSPSQNNGSSTTSQGLSTGTRTGLAFGIMFLLIFCAMLVCYLRKRSRRARESVGYEAALLSSEVGQYRPPDSVASRERDLPPPPQLDTAYLNSPDISHSSSLSAISGAAPLLSENSHLSSHLTSTWNRYSISSQASDSQQIATQNAPILPNPYDPFSAPARSASYTSTASSPTHSIPHGSLIPASAAMMGTFATPVASSSSNVQPERRLSALHTDMTLHQKQLELDHRKRSLDAQEVQDPPPQYSS